MNSCNICLKETNKVCAACEQVFYCGEECAKKDWKTTHSVLCNIEFIGLNSSISTYKQRRFYKASLEKMKSLFRTDFFAWMCIVSYKTTSTINYLLYGAKGNLNSIDQTFNNIVKKIPNITNAQQGEAPYSIYATFFKLCLLRGYSIGYPLRDPKTGQPVLTEAHLISAFPAMRNPLRMRDRNAFVRLYVKTIQNAIFSLPTIKKDKVFGFRGYSAVNLPGTMATDVRNMKKNQIITNWGFTSVSLDSRVSTDFANEQQQCCVVQLVIPAGYNVFLISGNASDKNFPQDMSGYSQLEILLPVGSTFKVTTPSPTLYKWPTTKPGKTIQSYSATLKLIGIKKYK
jgi:hypothetical protein